MNTYETFATVEQSGEVRVAGVPFKAGTRVEVTITSLDAGTAAPPQRVIRLLAALDKSRNCEPVGALRRDELYDRGVVR